MKKFVIVPIAILLFVSCETNGPRPISYNQDACDFCKMSISESRFAAELVTVKGRVYKFDDLKCLLQYDTSNNEIAVKNYYVGDFTEKEQLIDATTALFVKDEALRSPMGGNIAAFTTQEAAADYAGKSQANIVKWDDLIKTDQAGDSQGDGDLHH